MWDNALCACMEQDLDKLKECVRELDAVAKEKKPCTFEEFWEMYPKKVGKGAARKVWNALRPSIHMSHMILEGLSLYLRSKQVQRGYICNPSTWLHQRRWEDTPEGAVDPVYNQKGFDCGF